MIYRSPLFWRLLYSFFLPLLVLLVLIGWLVGSAIRRNAVFEQDRLLALMVRAQVEHYRDWPVSTTDARFADLRAVGEQSGLRFTLVSPAGQVLADTAVIPAGSDNYLQRPEILQAAQFGEGRAQNFSPSLGQTFRFTARAVRNQRGRLVGFLRGGYSLATLQDQIQTALMRLYGGLGLAGLAGLLLAYLLARRVASPLQQMTTLAETIARGDFDRRLPVNRAGFDRLALAINELARASAERVESVTTERNRLAALFAGMTEGVIGVDRQQRIQHINEEALRLLDLSAVACLKKPLWELVREPALISAMDRAIADKSVVRDRVRLAGQGRERVIDLYAAFMGNESGEPLGAVIVLDDVTDLERLARVRTDFVANASHELKTPITAIRGLSETMLADEGMSVTDLRSFTGRIHAQSLRLSHLVSDLMTLSRLESMQKDSDAMEALDLTRLVEQAVAELLPAAESRGQSLEAGLPEMKVCVAGDRHQLIQMLDNLIDNAIKYTPDKGHIKVSLVQEGGWAELQVRDDGVGILPQYQKRIFERFYRVDKVRSQSLGGTGLGLSIVKNIVDRHRGEIILRSQPGNGSQFIIRLPLEGSK